MSQATHQTRDIQAECEAFRDMSMAWKNSICSRIVGLGDSLEQTLWCLLANGHILLEGVRNSAHPIGVAGSHAGAIGERGWNHIRA